MMSKRLPVYGLIFLLLLAIFLAGLAWQEAENAWLGNEDKTLFKTMLYYQSWLMPFFLVWVIVGFKHKQVSLGFLWVALIGGTLGIYARFIEPNLLVVKYSTIKTGYTLKLALISDMHYGLYSTPQQMQRLVDKLNTLDVDAIVVAGDWTYEPSKKIDLAQQFQPFSQLKTVVYSVVGNHDEQRPGPPLEKELKAALIANKVRPIDGQSVDLGVARLAGIGDIVAHAVGQERLSALNIQDKPLLLLTHNPDSYYGLPSLKQPFVLLAGHTHGGQVNLPVVTEKILKIVTQQGYQRGWYALPNNNQLFVSSGIGMIGLPLRFNMPPVIDVLIFQ
jgi:predicted MPP superfamily phosphohydrolase